MKKRRFRLQEYIFFCREVLEFFQKRKRRLPIKLKFEKGIPVELDGEKIDGVTLIEKLNKIQKALRKVDSAQAAQFGKYNIPGLM